MRNIWEYSIYLCMNYLEKITKIIELCLSTYLTVIIGKLDAFEYYSTQEYKNKQINFIRYFSSIKNYDSNELIADNVKDSYFGNQLYDSLKIKKNLEFCEKHNYIKNYFTETQMVNAKLNEKNLFCINSSLYCILFYNDWIENLDTYYSYVDALGTACFEENPKIDETGLDFPESSSEPLLHDMNPITAAIKRAAPAALIKPVFFIVKFFFPICVFNFIFKWINFIFIFIQFFMNRIKNKFK